MQLDKQQDKALKEIERWFKQCLVERKAGKPLSRPFFYLAGYAGVGKTTLAKYFREFVEGTVLYAAYTGKAALQLRKAGCYGASTVHSLTYALDDDSGSQPVFVLNPDSKIKYAALVCLDEMSMVNTEMGEDLLTFGCPLLVLGDPGQLPPPSGCGYFTNRTPDVLLTEVHRQALDSNILRIATDVRNGKLLKRESHDDALIYPFPGDFTHEHVIKNYSQLLVGKHKTRESTNRLARRIYGYSGDTPVAGEKLICTRNNKELNLYNGQIFNVNQIRAADEERVVADLISEDDVKIRDVQINTRCFTEPEQLKESPWSERAEFQEFDFGYAITVHKSQGSQWDKVAVIDDGMLAWEKSARRCWLYTAITRAQENLIVLRGKK